MSPINNSTTARAHPYARGTPILTRSRARKEEDEALASILPSLATGTVVNKAPSSSGEALLKVAESSDKANNTDESSDSGVRSGDAASASSEVEINKVEPSGSGVGPGHIESSGSDAGSGHAASPTPMGEFIKVESSDSGVSRHAGAIVYPLSYERSSGPVRTAKASARVDPYRRATPRRLASGTNKDRTASPSPSDGPSSWYGCGSDDAPAWSSGPVSDAPAPPAESAAHPAGDDNNGSGDEHSVSSAPHNNGADGSAHGEDSGSGSDSAESVSLGDTSDNSSSDDDSEEGHASEEEDELEEDELEEEEEAVVEEQQEGEEKEEQEVHDDDDDGYDADAESESSEDGFESFGSVEPASEEEDEVDTDPESKSEAGASTPPSPRHDSVLGKRRRDSDSDSDEEEEEVEQSPQAKRVRIANLVHPVPVERSALLSAHIEFGGLEHTTLDTLTGDIRSYEWMATDMLERAERMPPPTVDVADIESEILEEFAAEWGAPLWFLPVRLQEELWTFLPERRRAYEFLFEWSRLVVCLHKLSEARNAARPHLERYERLRLLLAREQAGTEDYLARRDQMEQAAQDAYSTARTAIAGATARLGA